MIMPLDRDPGHAQIKCASDGDQFDIPGESGLVNVLTDAALGAG
jgi:hypothetical protein